MTCQIAQRSCSKTVKRTLLQLQAACSDTANTYMQPSPETECAMLAQWATDAYYRVVISKYQGIPTICRAMRCFPQSSDIQVSCCTCLELLAASQQHTIHEAEGVALVIAAMKNHPQSIQVHSAACQALRDMSLSIMHHGVSNAAASGTDMDCINAVSVTQEEAQPKNKGSEIVMPDLIQLLERAKLMYMTPSGHSGANGLLSILNNSLDQKSLAVKVYAMDIESSVSTKGLSSQRCDDLLDWRTQIRPQMYG